ncbi:MAG TPA: tetratricopeptide repeat protein [Candidatus Kapabacteria bacterium]|nr:tetratricopeptide repeat protein [Candidatus Kapabacteria bacterium]
MGTADQERIIEAIERRLLMAQDRNRKLDLILEFLDEAAAGAAPYSVGLASEGYRLAASSRNMAAAARILRRRGEAYVVLGNHDAGAADLVEAYCINVDLGHDSEAAVCALQAGRAHLAAGMAPHAIDWLHTALERAMHAGASDLQAAAALSIGDLRMSIGDYPKALGYYLDALRLYESSDVHDGVGHALAAVGILYGRTNDHTTAREYLRRSAEVFRESGNRLREVDALRHLAEIDLATGNGESAAEHGLRALTIYETLGDLQNVGTVLAMLGRVHAARHEYDAALGLTMRAYSLLGQSPDDTRRVELLLDMGRLHTALGAMDDAVFVLDQALALARAIDDRRLQYEVHGAISHAYHHLGQIEWAFEHYRHFAELRNELAGREKQHAIAELQVRFDLEKAEREREMYRLQVEGLRAEMRLKQNELTAMAVNLLQKKELLADMQYQLEKLHGESRRSGTDTVERMISEITSTKHADADWKIFEQQLDHLHQDFIRLLSERCPLLTPTELKICSLARINLSTKDVAAILCTSVRTVDSHKYNIRRKLRLDSKVSLTTFLASL